MTGADFALARRRRHGATIGEHLTKCRGPILFSSAVREVTRDAYGFECPCGAQFSITAHDLLGGKLATVDQLNSAKRRFS